MLWFLSTMAATLVVCEDDRFPLHTVDHHTLADAVAAASVGDTIVLCPGAFDGAVAVETDVTVVGAFGRDRSTVSGETLVRAAVEFRDLRLGGDGRELDIPSTRSARLVRVLSDEAGTTPPGGDGGLADVEGTLLVIDSVVQNVSAPHGGAVRGRGDATVLVRDALLRLCVHRRKPSRRCPLPQ